LFFCLKQINQQKIFKKTYVIGNFVELILFAEYIVPYLCPLVNTFSFIYLVFVCIFLILVDFLCCFLKKKYC